MVAMTDEPIDEPADVPTEAPLDPVDAFFGVQDTSDEGFHSGFVSLVGRPNVGKSTLLNRILDRKVSIVSDKAQTTRNQIRGVLTRESSQVVFVDTPGIHKPHTLMGERLPRLMNVMASSCVPSTNTMPATSTGNRR